MAPLIRKLGLVLLVVLARPVAAADCIGGETSFECQLAQQVLALENDECCPDCVKNPALGSTTVAGADEFPGLKPGRTYPFGYGVAGLDLGTVTARVANGQYDIGDGKLGVRPIIVDDQQVAGSSAMDEYLRAQARQSESAFKDDDPIFAVITHDNSGSSTDLHRYLALQSGNDSIGAYLGFGETAHNPPQYHSHRWGVRGNPANVTTVSLLGEKQSEVNRNLHNVTRVLQVNADYHNSAAPSITHVSLGESLAYYREALMLHRRYEIAMEDGADTALIDRDREAMRNSGADHVHMILTVGLNLPHNVESFEEAFPTEGYYLLAIAQRMGAQGTDFTPLWAKEGLEGPRQASGTQALPWYPMEQTDFLRQSIRNVIPPMARGGFAAAVAQGSAQDAITRKWIADSDCKTLFDYGVTAASQNAYRSLRNDHTGSGGVPLNSLDRWRRLHATQSGTEYVDPYSAFSNPDARLMPPVVLSWMQNGLRRSNPFVRLKTVATAVDKNEQKVVIPPAPSLTEI